MDSRLPSGRERHLLGRIETLERIAAASQGGNGTLTVRVFSERGGLATSPAAEVQLVAVPPEGALVSFPGLAAARVTRSRS